MGYLFGQNSRHWIFLRFCQTFWFLPVTSVQAERQQEILPVVLPRTLPLVLVKFLPSYVGTFLEHEK
jgi:hypothetical protein